MRRMMTIVQAFLTDEVGLETVEYAIITGLIVSGTIASVAFIGDWVSGQYGNMSDTLTTRLLHSLVRAFPISVMARDSATRPV